MHRAVSLFGSETHHTERLRHKGPWDGCRLAFAPAIVPIRFFFMRAKLILRRVGTTQVKTRPLVICLLICCYFLKHKDNLSVFFIYKQTPLNIAMFLWQEQMADFFREMNL